MLNYAISLSKHDMLASCKEKLEEFEPLYRNNKTDELISHDKEIKEAVKNLNLLLS